MSTSVFPVAPRTRTDKRASALIILSIVSATAARQVLSPLQELVGADLHLSDNQVALLQGLALALPLIFLSFPIGRLVDRFRRVRLLFVFSVGCGVGSVLTALSYDFATLFAVRMLVGLSFAGVFMTALSLISDVSSAASRGRAVMLLYLGQVCGGASCFAIVGALVNRLPGWLPVGSTLHGLAPWRLMQLLFAIGILLCALPMLLLREPPRQETGEPTEQGTRAALRQLWGYRRVLVPLLIGLATINMADSAAGIWAVPVLTRTFHQQPSDFGTWMAVVALFAGIGGAVAGGTLSDYGQRIAGRAGILVGAILGAAVSIPGAFYPMMPSVGGFGTILALFLVAGNCNGTAATAAVTVLIPNRLRGITTSIFGTISMLVAYGLAPLLVSFTSGAFGFGADINVPLTAIGCVTSVIGLIAFLVSMRDARREATNAQSQFVEGAHHAR